MDRRVCVGVVAAAIAALLTACSGGIAPRASVSFAPTRPSVVSADTPGPQTHAHHRRAVRPCDAKSLVARAGRESDGTSFAAAGDVELKNVGRDPCRLRGVPHVAIARSDGENLGLEFAVFNDRPVLRSVVLPVGKPSAATMHLVWVNWCGGRLGPLKIRIRLPHSRGTVVASFDGPPDYNLVPSCESASRPSKLELLEAYSYQ
jgi:Protein of unknown function (DUF4232)